MEPLKPHVRKNALNQNPGASEDDLNEYQRLLAERFMIDPNMPKSPAVDAAGQVREARLAALRDKLFRAAAKTT